MTHSMDGGVSAGGAVSADGLISLSALPCRAFDLFPEYIQDSADALRALGTGVNDQVATMKTTWSGLSGCYEAPEQEQVYALMDKPADAATDFKGRFDKAAGYLDTYAADLDTIKGELQHFESDTQKFITEALQGYNEPVPHLATQTSAPELEEPQTEHVAWNEHKEAINKNERLLGWYNQIIAKISKAASDCANGLNSLQMGSKEAAVKPITLDELNQASEQGQMPWGAPVEEDKNTFELIVDGLIVEPVKGVGALAGFDGDPSTARGDTRAQAWKGLGMFVGGTVAALSPTTYLGLLLPPDSVFGGYARTMLNSAATGWGGMIGWDHQAHLNGEDGWHKYKEDGVAASVVSVVNVGSLFTGVGAVATGTKTLVKGGKAAATAGGKSTKLTKYAKGGASGSTAAKVSTAVADLVVPGGGWVLSKGFRAFDMPDAPAMNPASIADDLGEGAGKGRGAHDLPAADRESGSSTSAADATGAASRPGSLGNRTPSDVATDAQRPAGDAPDSHAQGSNSADSAGRSSGHSDRAVPEGSTPRSHESSGPEHGSSSKPDQDVDGKAGNTADSHAQGSGSAGSAGRAAGHSESASPEGRAAETSKNTPANHDAAPEADTAGADRTGDIADSRGEGSGSTSRADAHGEDTSHGGRAPESTDRVPAGHDAAKGADAAGASERARDSSSTAGRDTTAGGSATHAAEHGERESGASGDPAGRDHGSSAATGDGRAAPTAHDGHRPDPISEPEGGKADGQDVHTGQESHAHEGLRGHVDSSTHGSSDSSQPDTGAETDGSTAPQHASAGSQWQPPHVDHQVTVTDNIGSRTTFPPKGFTTEPHTAYEVPDRGTYYTDGEGNVSHVVTDYGPSHTPNPDLNKPASNTTYVVNDRHVFVTDSKARTVEVHAPHLERAEAARSSHIQQNVGHASGPGYDGGHLLQNALGGGRERINIVGMLEEVNRSGSSKYAAPAENYYRLESELRTAALKGSDTSMDIYVRYSDGSTPTEFIVEYTVDGMPSIERFRNVR
ncbi:DNA/RNA non-specific endonuclease [Brachybacterium endophyticum]|nr:DNA/RNA non-specific endonuclease [Brachybacterium endophyticum]